MMKQMTKKLMAALLTVSMAAGLMIGCGSKSAGSDAAGGAAAQSGCICAQGARKEHQIKRNQEDSGRWPHLPFAADCYAVESKREDGDLSIQRPQDRICQHRRQRKGREAG